MSAPARHNRSTSSPSSISSLRQHRSTTTTSAAESGTVVGAGSSVTIVNVDERKQQQRQRMRMPLQQQQQRGREASLPGYAMHGSSHSEVPVHLRNRQRLRQQQFHPRPGGGGGSSYSGQGHGGHQGGYYEHGGLVLSAAASTGGDGGTPAILGGLSAAATGASADDNGRTNDNDDAGGGIHLWRRRRRRSRGGDGESSTTMAAAHGHGGTNVKQDVRGASSAAGLPPGLTLAPGLTPGLGLGPSSSSARSEVSVSSAASSTSHIHSAVAGSLKKIFQTATATTTTQSKDGYGGGGGATYRTAAPSYNVNEDEDRGFPGAGRGQQLEGAVVFVDGDSNGTQNSRQQRPQSSSSSAAAFARDAPRAGYLQKLGQNVPEFKRRFFVLKPTTHLYYFVSPHDAEPRGCIDLERDDVAVQYLEDTFQHNDGSCRFELVFGGGSSGGSGGNDNDKGDESGASSSSNSKRLDPESSSIVDDSNDVSRRPEFQGDGGGDSSNDNQKHHATTTATTKIVLEARTKEIADEWVQSIRQERLSYVKTVRDKLHRENADLAGKVISLEQQLEDYKLVEQDRDGALQDAAAWKDRFDRLNEAVRILTRVVKRREPAEVGGEVIDTAIIEGGQKDAAGEEAVDDYREGVGERVLGDGCRRKYSSTHEKEEQTDNDIALVPSNNNQIESDDDEGPCKAPAPCGSSPDNSSSGPKGEVVKESTCIETKDVGDAQLLESKSTAPQSSNPTRSSGSEDPSDSTGSYLLSILGKEEQILDRMDLSGTNFSSLSNACHMLRENLALTSQEASSAVEEVHAANERANALESRMAKAERLIARLWEENCDLRKTVQRQKKERKLLVKELKSLLVRPRSTCTGAPATSKTLSQDQASFVSNQTYTEQDRHHPPLGSAESRLILDLEEDIVSSLRLHEQFSAVNRNVPAETCSLPPWASFDADASSSIDSQSQRIASANAAISSELETIRTKSSLIQDDDLEEEESDGSDVEDGLNSPLQPRILVLDSVHDGESATSDVSSMAPSSCAGAIATVEPKFGDPVCENVAAGRKSHPSREETGNVDLLSQHEYGAFGTKAKRSHPGLRNLDEDWASEVIPLHRRCSSTTSLSSKRSRSVITDNGQATSRLMCPISTDVRPSTSRQEASSSQLGDDGEIYHLTFHSRKIGIQFQKVPAPSTPCGKLTAAISMDVHGGGAASETAAELKRVAEIAKKASGRTETQAEKEHRDEHELSCTVARPVDAVLVCGFHGFDDASNYHRPKLGARLVAFDGVSVEIGRWTFESVRKAIQARGRPLSLSFRNDYLNPEQRAILAKAVADVGTAAPVRTGTCNVQQPSEQAGTLKEVLYADEPARRSVSLPPAYPLSRQHWDHIHSQEGGVVTDREMTLNSGNHGSFSDASFSTPARDERRRGGDHYRSFSEAGTSSIISSTVAPLVAGLLSGLAKGETRSEAINPPYLSQDSRSSLDELSRHHDFKAGLL